MKFNLMSTACSICYFLITLFKIVKPHSWAACTKYTATISGQDYDDSSCEGYTRNWGNVYSSSSSFGADVGADYQPGGTSASGTWCDQTLGTSSQDYGDTYPTGYEMATYTIGETIRIVWPAKNHANYECFGNIPDTGMKLFVNTNRNPNSDPQTLSDWTEVIDWHDGETPGTDGVPFQNCPKFCDNTDRAVCYGDVVLDDDSLFSQGSGYYTFMWYWAFNNAEDIYTTCWEAYVETTSTGGTTNNNDDTTESPNTDTPSPVDNNGDDDDDNNNNNGDDDDNNNNNGDDDSGDDSDSLEYLIFIPVCVRGASYVEDLVLEGASNTISELEWSIYSYREEEDSSGFNVTIESHTDDSQYVVAATTSASNDDHTLCTNIIQVYDSNNPDEFILNCDSCTDVLVYRAVYNGDSDDDDEESNSTGGDSNTTTIIILSIVLTILLLCLIGGIVYYKFYYLKYNRRSNHYGSQDYGHGRKKLGSKKNILAAAHTSSQQAISYVDDDKAGRPTLR